MLTDSVFLVLMAAPVLFRVFQMLYADPYPKLDASILGTAMWTRTGIIAVLVIRRLEGVGFGFVPSKRDWLVGLRNYVFFVPIGLGLALLVGFIKLRPEPQNWALGLGTFLGIFFFVAASEEFFFRGFLQQLIERATQSQTTAIIIASVLFGLVHLGFRRQFPNWQFAVLAAVAGLFYGRAYVKTGSIRASMVTHALVVTTWRVFFV
jgi:membrane protease YdiL (CAAX protease family)